MTPDIYYSAIKLAEFQQLETEKRAREAWKWGSVQRQQLLLTSWFIFVIGR
ncbi:hypothetical protein D3C73_741660 [compost metagenome]